MKEYNIPELEKTAAEGSAQTAIVIWQSVIEVLKNEVSAASFGKWLKDLEFVADMEGVIQLV